MDKQKFIENLLLSIKKVCDLHDKIKGLDESLKKLQPIAVADNNIFYVFDVNPHKNEYEFIMEYLFPMQLPQKVLAAFPLDFYGNKAAAVISANELENLDNYVFVYHEFVHCYQWNNFEQNIRQGLAIEKQQRQNNNFMWEMNYPFPYDDIVFVSMTSALDGVSEENALDIFARYHYKMKDHLSETDYEYMVWQEWKEGYARYAENLIREKLGMAKNKNALSPPYGRVCFYETGSRYIEILIKSDNSLKSDMEKLFNKIRRITNQ